MTYERPFRRHSVLPVSICRHTVMRRPLAALLLIIVVTGCDDPPRPLTARRMVIAVGHGWSGTKLLGPTYPAASCHLRSEDDAPLPDPACTPGAIDSAVTQTTLATTICARGYTATVRPPLAVTSRPKRESAREYGIPAVGEYDHLIPLELGGSSDTRNMWLEPGKIPNPKDKVENRLKALVCQHKMTLAEAQRRIAADWTTALPS